MLTTRSIFSPHDTHIVNTTHIVEVHVVHTWGGRPSWPCHVNIDSNGGAFLLTPKYGPSDVQLGLIWGLGLRFDELSFKI